MRNIVAAALIALWCSAARGDVNFAVAPVAGDPQIACDKFGNLCSNIAPVTYTATGTLGILEAKSYINSGSAVTMTLPTGTVYHEQLIKQTGAGAVTVSGKLDGTTVQSLTLAATGGVSGYLFVYWDATLLYWVVRARQ